MTAVGDIVGDVYRASQKLRLDSYFTLCGGGLWWWLYYINYYIYYMYIIIFA